MTHGRHRAPRGRLTLAQRLGGAAIVLGASGFAAATWPTSAVADAPIQTAWYGAPDPATPAGGLHVAVASSQIVAFSAVQYALAEGSTATIEFKVANLTATPVVNPTAPTTDPAANVVACPITGTWKSGDAQSMDAAPKYDCSHSIFGNLSADQTTLTFFADASSEAVPGQLSLAILPVVTDEIPGAGTPAPADTTQPFSLDLAKPDTTSMTVTSTAALTPPPPVPHKGGATTASASGVAAGASGSGSGPANVSLPGSVTSNASTSTDTGSSPVVAPQNAAPATTPAAATAPAKSDRAHNAALAMLLLIGLGAVAMGSGQMQRAPRLLGGSGRHAALAGAAGAAAAAAPVVPMTPYGARGLGRFNKPRTEPARPLT